MSKEPTDAMVKSAHAAWIMALADLDDHDEMQVIMTDKQAETALSAAIKAALAAQPSDDAELLEVLKGFVQSISGRNTLDKMLTINSAELVDLVAKAMPLIAKQENRDG